MRDQKGFSLIELMVAMAIMLLISGAAVSALLKMGTAQATIWNRTQMHSGIRGATEVMQQEVGQAGRVALPTPVTLTANVTASTTAQAVTVSDLCGIFVNEDLAVDTGSNQETVAVTATSSTPTDTACASGAVSGSISGIFTLSHVSGQPVQAFGGFSAGIVPSSTTNGSSAGVLKLFGDVNDDRKMVYVEYSILPSCICSGTCTPSTTTGSLYRNSIAWNASSKPAVTSSQILLSNVTANPGGSACFTYQTQSIAGSPSDYVTDVAITLTVQTQQIDPVTKAYQTETKALLNVSPRNVFNAWEMASLGIMKRVQPIPPSITSLLP